MKEEAYVALLDRGRSMIPEHVFERARFQIPEVQAYQEGSRTFITNWRRIVRTLNREEGHVAKFLARLCSTAANPDGERLVLQGKFPAKLLDKHISAYSQAYVICSECGKPDTHLVHEKRMVMRICEACGARQTVKGV
ncbi:MAG: translation initiation factor IF-2 subunit beta [Candidatus Hodarchaeota archaeon]